MHFDQFDQVDEWGSCGLPADPDELVNCYDAAAPVDAVAALKQELERLRVHDEDESPITPVSKKDQEELRRPATITQAG